MFVCTNLCFFLSFHFLFFLAGEFIGSDFYSCCLLISNMCCLVFNIRMCTLMTSLLKLLYHPLGLVMTKGGKGFSHHTVYIEILEIFYKLQVHHAINILDLKLLACIFEEKNGCYYL